MILNVRIVDGKVNSGIQFRSEALPNGQVRGPQADIGDGFWGKLYEEFGRAWLWEGNECDQHHVEKEDWNEYEDRKSTRLNSSHVAISYAVFCLRKKNSTN